MNSRYQAEDGRFRELHRQPQRNFAHRPQTDRRGAQVFGAERRRRRWQALDLQRGDATVAEPEPEHPVIAGISDEQRVADDAEFSRAMHIHRQRLQPSW